MQIPIICESFGWTYQEYIEQPTWFINLIKERMQIDAKNQSQELKKLKSK